MVISSTNTYLTELADWAQNKALTFVMTGKKKGAINQAGGKWYGPSGKWLRWNRVTRRPGPNWTQPQDYIPSYWAGYHDRTAFYIRDFVHQAPGAELIGLHEENYSMLSSLVRGAGDHTGGWAPWALNFDGSIYYLDTPNRRRFVRELTAQYELVETIAGLYRMSGDPRYIDPMMLGFAEQILGSFTRERDGVVLREKNGIPEGRGNIWIGSSSYNESGVLLAESGDCSAALYAALCAYGSLCAALGRAGEADTYRRRAKELRTYFNNEWSVPPREDGCGYVFGVGFHGEKYWQWKKSARGITGAETCFFMPLKLLTEPGARNGRLLDYIDRMDGDGRTASENIESFTYLPQVFFPYHQAERAWKWMKYIGDRRMQTYMYGNQGLNEDYPELSFTMISAAVEGLLGLQVDVPAGTVVTCPCLPEEIPDLAVRSLHLGPLALDIVLPDVRTVELCNHSDRPIQWCCAFAGAGAQMDVNGAVCPAEDETVNGVRRSTRSIRIAPGETVRVCAV